MARISTKEIQFTGLILALYSILRLLPRVFDYPILVILSAIIWPVISGRIKTGLMIWWVKEALDLAIVQIMWAGDLALYQLEGPPFIVLPFFITMSVMLYYMWFRISYMIFKKVGLHRRIKHITSDLLLI